MKKIITVLVSILIAVVIVVGGFLLIVTHDFSGSAPVSVKACTNPHIASDGKTKVSAHRSGGGIAPENTMMAFKYCVESPDFEIDVFEFDVQITKDGKLVLLHDETLSRTSDSTEAFGRNDAKASEYTYDELRKLNMGENFQTETGEMPFKGLRGDNIPEDLHIVSINDVLSYLTANGNYDYIIEIKDDGELGKKACDELYRVLTEFSLLEKAVIGTFHDEITAYMENYPDMKRSAGMNEVAAFYFDSLLGINRPEGYYPYVALQIPDVYYVVKLGTTRLINYAHENNIAVQYWTINDEATAKELSSKGADAIMSDLPDMIYEIVNE